MFKNCATLQAKMAMKHSDKLVAKVFEELNKDEEILSLEEFEKLVTKNEIQRKRQLSTSKN